jgi:hypothetical protein
VSVLLDKHRKSLQNLYDIYAEVSAERNDAFRDDELMSIGVRDHTTRTITYALPHVYTLHVCQPSPPPPPPLPPPPPYQRPES